MKKRIAGPLAAALMLVASLAGAGGAAAASSKVTISGKAYIFNHMDTAISGATIKVRELPKLSTTTNSVGDYKLKVPNDTNVTPYILSGEGDLTVRPRSGAESVQHYHWNEIDLQTFHTRGKSLVNANFQAPADAEYGGLKALLSVPAGADGRPEQCAIVTTASARDVRGVNYQTFWDRTPHGVPGATSTELPGLEGPIYFNEFVIPDKTKTETSEDGGIVWSVVPTGTYRIVTTSPTARFASFLATCKPGRVINANPPWGAYELSPGEKPLGASNVAASVTSAKVDRNGPKGRVAKVKLVSGEAIKAKIEVMAGGRKVATRKVTLKPGQKLVKIGLGAGVKGSKATVKTRLEDKSGVAFTSKRTVGLPQA